MNSRFGRHVHQDLANFSGQEVSGLRIDRLASRYAKAVEERKAIEAANAQEFRLNIPHIQYVQKRIAEELEAEASEMNGKLPVAAVYDALQIVKARKDSDSDAGLRALRGHLEKIWKRDRGASITASSYLKLHDHYRRNFPKSAAADVITEIGQKGYATLPVSDLQHIASTIQSQADYDDAMIQHGLAGPLPHQVKARQYVLALVNGEEVDDDDYGMATLGGHHQAQAGLADDERSINGILFYWDTESNPEDPGWVWEDTYDKSVPSYPVAVKGYVGRDPDASDEELWDAIEGDVPETVRTYRRQAQESGGSRSLQMNVTKAEAAREIAELVRDAMTGTKMDVTIGLMEDGTVDEAFNVYGQFSDMVIPIYDTADGWTLGDWEGDPSDESTWTEDALSSLAGAFEDMWIDEAIETALSYDDYSEDAEAYDGVVWAGEGRKSRRQAPAPPEHMDEELGAGEFDDQEIEPPPDQDIIDQLHQWSASGHPSYQVASNWSSGHSVPASAVEAMLDEFSKMYWVEKDAGRVEEAEDLSDLMDYVEYYLGEAYPESKDKEASRPFGDDRHTALGPPTWPSQEEAPDPGRKCEHCGSPLNEFEEITCDECEIEQLESLLSNERWLEVRGPQMKEELEKDLAALKSRQGRVAQEDDEDYEDYEDADEEEDLDWTKEVEVHLDNQDHDDGSVLVFVEHPKAEEWVDLEQSIEGSNWEVAGDMPGFAYTVITDRPNLAEDLRAEGYNINDDDYWDFEDHYTEEDIDRLSRGE